MRHGRVKNDELCNHYSDVNGIFQQLLNAQKAIEVAGGTLIRLNRCFY